MSKYGMRRDKSAITAPAALGARDFASATLEFYLAGVAAVVFEVFCVSPKVVSAPGGSSGGGGFGSVCRHERSAERTGTEDG